MKRTTIVRIAEWTGWCGPCAAERPLVLTRTGRHSLRSWFGSDGQDRPLTLTCRLCGVGVAVPPEADDPEILVSEEILVGEQPVVPLHESAATAALDRTSATTARLPAVHPLPVEAAVPALPTAPVAVADPVHVPALASATTTAPARAAGEPASALHAVRQDLASALALLVEQRAAASPPAPVLPQQRAAETAAPVDGLQALQLLAEGLDLLGAQR